MKRMIKVSRLAKLLAPSGFAMSYDPGGSSITYARPVKSSELWEWILINVGGKNGESVGAYVGASICYGLGAQGTSEDRFVRESIRRNDQGLLLTDPADAEAWEREMADMLPAHARAFTTKVGPALLARTAETRSAVHRYVELFGTKDWRQLWERLEPRATAKEVREAERIARTPPTIQIFNGFNFYRTIILGIILYSDQVEGRQVVPAGVEPWPAFDPWSKKPVDWSKWGLAWRIELLADRMLAQYPEVMPSSFPEADGE